MDDEVDSVRATDADLEELARLAGADEHDEVVELQDSRGVAVGVEDVLVVHVVFACAGQDHRFHVVNLS